MPHRELFLFFPETMFASGLLDFGSLSPSLREPLGPKKLHNFVNLINVTELFTLNWLIYVTRISLQ